MKTYNVNHNNTITVNGVSVSLPFKTNKEFLVEDEDFKIEYHTQPSCWGVGDVGDEIETHVMAVLSKVDTTELDKSLETIARLHKEFPNEWISSKDELPSEGENVEISDDGINSDGTVDYKSDRVCMMAGFAGGFGYFSKCGFATDGSQGEDKNLILDTPNYWRRIL